MSTQTNMISNEEWDEMIKKVCPRHKLKQCSTGSFFDSYFETLSELLQNIKENPYEVSEKDEDKNRLIRDLSSMYSLFVCYHYIMCDYAEYDAKKNNREEFTFEYPILKGFFDKGFPCSHNFNKYLYSEKYPFTVWLYQKYYKLVVEVVSTFCDSKGTVFPKYLYNLSETQNGFLRIEILEYFDWADIPHKKGANLDLPNYHQINGDSGTLEDYKKLYKKYFPNDSGCYSFDNVWERFLESNWPIIEWIQKNRKLGSFKENHISYRDNNVCLRKGISWLLQNPDEEQWINEGKWNERNKERISVK